jgi:hypothetical protein
MNEMFMFPVAGLKKTCTLWPFKAARGLLKGVA